MSTSCLDRQCYKSCLSNGFKWRKYKFRSDKEFIQIYNEDSFKGYTLEVIVKCPKKLYKLHIDLLLLPKKIKIEKCGKLVCKSYL